MSQRKARPPPPLDPAAGALQDALFNVIPEAVLFARFPDRRILDVNDAFLKLFGLTREEAVNLTTEAIHVDDEHFQRFGALVQERARVGGDFTVEWPLRRGDGTQFPAELSVSMVSPYVGEPVGMVGVIRDLSARRRAETWERVHSQVLERMVEGVCITRDGEGLIIYTNPAQDAMFGYERGELLGKFNAAGNNVLANDRGAFINPDLSKSAERMVGETLGVPVERGTLAGLKTVGSAACVTAKGVLCHPKTSDEELDLLEKLFGVEADIGTVNHGAPFIGAGLVANSNGALVGTLTTGPELNRIENALNLI